LGGAQVSGARKVRIWAPGSIISVPFPPLFFTLEHSALFFGSLHF
jgi:hypothetical protein